MKILVFTRGFIPQIGGIEILMSMLGNEWVGQGHEVSVITETEGASERNGIRTFTKPSLFQKVKLLWTCDVFLMPNLSLRGFILWLWAPWKKMVITHQTWYGHWEGKKSVNARVKIWLCRFATNISCSAFLSHQLPYKSEVIPNCYNRTLFYERIPQTKKHGIGFVGRLVSDKGIDILLEAMLILKNKGVAQTLGIIGDGPERKMVEQFQQTHPELQIQLLGNKTGEDLSMAMNGFEVLVVPSTWYEPFGIVALEGLACGCKVVASEKGGITEAAGALGFYFENGNAEACALKIEEALGAVYPKKEVVAEHLEKFKVEKVAEQYLDVFNRVV